MTATDETACDVVNHVGELWAYRDEVTLQRVYSQWYARVRATDDVPACKELRDFFLATPDNGRFRIWSLCAVLADGTALAHRDGMSQVFRPGDYLAADATSRRILVPASKRWLDASTGFGWWTNSLIGWVDSRCCLSRLYCNVGPSAVPHVVRAVADSGLPATLKACLLPNAQGRRDALVVYHHQQDLPRLVTLVEGLGKLYGRGRPPALTMPVAPGIGFANDPGDDESSFGLLVSEIACLALESAKSRGDLLREWRAACVSSGIDPARPWLARRSPLRALKGRGDEP